MGHVSFNPSGESIVLRLQVGGVDPDTFRNVFVALDTGASTTMIPTEVAVDLGYDLSNPNEQMMTANGIVLAKPTLILS
jgi:predicted aspartyl protease